MKLCDNHWKMLNDEVDRLGLGDHVQMDREHAPGMADLVAQGFIDAAKGEDLNRDPLRFAYLNIIGKATQAIPPTIEDDPLNQEGGNEICPIDYLNEKRGPEGTCKCPDPNCAGKEPGSIPDFETWIVGEDSAIQFVQGIFVEEGWVTV